MSHDGYPAHDILIMLAHLRHGPEVEGVEPESDDQVRIEVVPSDAVAYPLGLPVAGVGEEVGYPLGAAPFTGNMDPPALHHPCLLEPPG